MKPGSAGLPFFGVEPLILDPHTGKELVGECSGMLCLRNSTPSLARSVFGDHSRYKSTYFNQYPGYYFTGDGAKRDADGYYWITGRVDGTV